MRERTTWNKDEITKRAAFSRTADPYTMNQDHASQQPAADAYTTGDPSDFAEDVSSNSWSSEYSGGQVKRNELGMPEMRGDTFNHAEKTAATELLYKKATLTVKVARLMLKTANESVLEEQSLALMHLPDAELIGTFNRLAKKAEEEEAKDQGQQKQAQDQEEQKQDEAQQKQAQDQQQDEGKGQQQQAKQAGELPPALKENAEKKKQEAEEKKQDEAQQKQAGNDHMAAALAAMQSGDMKSAGDAMQKAVQAAVAQMQQAQQQQLQAQQPMQQQADMQQQIAQMVQQAAEQCMSQMQQPQAQSQMQQPMANEGDLLDQMLQSDGMMPASEMDIELEAPEMDVMGSGLGAEDDVLRQLFANEESEAQQQLQDGDQGQQKQAAIRTASSRTVGTRPTAGVSQIGGTTKVAGNGNSGVDNLSKLWTSAPDVRDVFGIPKS